jgi:universal stress protein A
LVPVDFSECSKAALRYAIFLARSLGAHVDVLYVWEQRADDTSTLHHVPTTNFACEAVRDVASANVSIELRRWLSTLVDAPTRSLEARVEVGDPEEIILTLAEQDDCDLIVLGSSGHVESSDAFVGSVAERILRYAACPVLLVGVSAHHHHTHTVEAAGF